MKKIQMTCIFLVLAACCMTSCKASSSKAQAATEAKESTQAAEELIVNTDSCALQDGTLSCLVKVDYPTEPTELSQNVRKILNQELGKLFLPLIGEEGNSKYKVYSGDLANGNTILKYYADNNMAYLREQLKDITEADPKAKISMSYEVNLSKQEETDSYITYNTFSYAYLAGAHGSTTDYSFNINKATGKVVSETVDTTQVKALQPILRKGVLSYLNSEDNDNPVDDSSLNDYLFIDNGIIPMPACTPYLAKDGVHFTYQQYEIGPYAMGLVSFTVPYADIKPFLTPEALKLLK